MDEAVVGVPLYQCLYLASKISHTLGKCVTCFTFHTYLPNLVITLMAFDQWNQCNSIDATLIITIKIE